MGSAKRGTSAAAVLKDTSSKLFKNRVEEGIRSKREQVTGDWRKLDNEERYHFHYLPNVIPMVK